MLYQAVGLSPLAAFFINSFIALFSHLRLFKSSSNISSWSSSPPACGSNRQPLNSIKSNTFSAYCGSLYSVHNFSSYPSSGSTVSTPSARSRWRISFSMSAFHGSAWLPPGCRRHLSVIPNEDLVRTHIVPNLLQAAQVIA